MSQPFEFLNQFYKHGFQKSGVIKHIFTLCILPIFCLQLPLKVKYTFYCYWEINRVFFDLKTFTQTFLKQFLIETLIVSYFKLNAQKHTFNKFKHVKRVFLMFWDCNSYTFSIIYRLPKYILFFSLFSEFLPHLWKTSFCSIFYMIKAKVKKICLK